MKNDLAGRVAAARAKQAEAAVRAAADDGRLEVVVPPRSFVADDVPRTDPADLKSKETRAALVAAGVPLDYAELALSEAVHDTSSVHHLRSALTKGARFVVLAGDVGVGKSMAAACWLRQMRSIHGPCGMQWRHAHQLARIAGYGHEDEQKLLEQCNFLVLDDLGVEFNDAKGFLAATIDSLVYQRHGNRRHTVCTTNLALDDFRARYGPRVTDRLKQVGVFLEIAGQSLRTALRQPEAAS